MGRKITPKRSTKTKNVKKAKMDHKDWRDSRNTLNAKMGYLLDSSLYSDVTLVVNEGNKKKEFKVHEFMLRLSSCVFETALNGGFKESSTKNITIHDIKIDIFGLFLDFLYMKDIKLTSLEQSMELYKVADRYMTSSLKEFCINYIKANKNLTTACTGWEFANFYMVKDLESDYLEMIKKDTKSVIASDDFLKASMEIVSTILNQDQLNIGRELVLFNAIEKWINNTVQNKGLTKEELCINLIPKIRYKSMTPQEFLDGPVNSGLLKYDDWPAILAHLTTSKCDLPYPLGFTETCRTCRMPVTLPHELPILNQTRSVYNFGPQYL